MNPLFFWSLAPSRSRPPRRVPLRRLRRFFVPISSDYDRFELPRIIENPAESGSIEGGGEVGFKERERENEGRESSPSIVAPAAISTTEGDFPVFYGMKTGGFSRGRVLRGIFHPSLNTFRSDTVLGEDSREFLWFLDQGEETIRREDNCLSD